MAYIHLTPLPFKVKLVLIDSRILKGTYTSREKMLIFTFYEGQGVC